MGGVGRWDSRNQLVGGAILLILGICLAPLAALLFSLDGGAATTSPFDGRTLRLFTDSVLLNALVAAVSVVLGLLIAYALVRLNIPLRLPLLGLFTLPLFIPSYIHALSWSRLLGEAGAINGWFRNLTQGTERLFSIDGWWGTVWVLVLSYYPIALLIVSAGLLRWEQRFHEAALLSGGPRWALWLQFTYLRQYLLVAGMLIFFFAFSDFGVPDLFQVHVYATEVFIRLSAYLDTRGAVVASLLPVTFGLILLWPLVRMARRLRSRVGNGGERPPSAHVLGRWRYAIFMGLVMLAVVMVLLPLGYLVYLTEGLATLWRALGVVWRDTLSSTVIAAAATVLATALAMLGAYGYMRGLRPAGAWLHVVSVLMLVLPASLLGIGFIVLWNQDGWLGWLYRSGAVVVLGLGARWLPVAFEVLTAAWAQLPAAQEDAAFSTGVPWFAAFRNILLPQVLPAIRIAALLVFILAFNELTMMVLLAPPGVSSLPIRIFSTVHYGPDSLLAAASLWQVLFLMVPVGLLSWYSRQYFAVGAEGRTC